MVEVILFSVSCALIVYWIWTQHFKVTNEPPRSTGWWPIIGHGHRLVGDISKLWYTMREFANEAVKMDGGITVSLGPRKKLYIITDPDDCWKVSNENLEKSYIYDFAKAWLGDGLVTSKPSVWKRHRKLLNPAFQQAALEQFQVVFNQQASRLVDALAPNDGKGPMDFLHYMERCALASICLAVLEVDLNDNDLKNSQYIVALRALLDIFIRRFQNVLMHNEWYYGWTSLKSEQDGYIHTMQNFTNTVIQSKRRDMNVNVSTNGLREEKFGGEFKSFLQILLEQKEEGSQNTPAFTDQDVREQLNTFVFAGHDTCATTITYICVMLGSYPDVQNKVYTEVQDVFGQSNRDVNKTDLKRLVYMEAVMKESMRLLPIAPFIARHLDRDVKLKNYTLAAGNECALSLYSANRDPIWGADAHAFRPERFLEPTLPDHTAALATFGIGKRHCIGRSYAMMFMKTVLVHMMRQYKVTADYKNMELKMGAMLKPISGHYISIEQRT